MEKRVVLVTLQIIAIFRVAHLAAVLLRFLLDGMEGDGFLHLLDCAVETHRRMRGFVVGKRLGGMHIDEVGIVVLIFLLHLLQLLLIVLLSVEINVVSGGERLHKTGAGGVFLRAARQQHGAQHCYHNRQICRRPALHT